MREKFWEKVAERVTRQWDRESHATVEPTVRTTFFETFQSDLGEILRKRRWERDHATVSWESRDRRPTVNTTVYLDVSKRFDENFEKSRWTVTRQWLRSRDRRPICQTTFFRRFKRFGKILKKVAERSRDSGWGHATVGRLSRHTFFGRFIAIWENCWKKSLNGHASWIEVTRPSADCQTTFFWTYPKRFGIWFWKKSQERSRHSVVEVTRPIGRLSNNVFWTFQAIRRKIWTRYTVCWGRMSWRATVVGGHATLGRLSNNVFWTYQAIWEIFWKKVA